MKISVFSYLDCVRAVMNRNNINSSLAIISIQDDGGFGFEFIPSNKCKVLTLQFDDVDIDEEMLIKAGYENFDENSLGFKLFSDDDAKAIVSFIFENIDVDDLYIHCYAGRSRSQAVGAAISKYLTGEDKRYFSGNSPNMRVYKKLSEAFSLF